MTSRVVDACIVGAGVIGLTTAVWFAERGLTVRVLARELPPNTDSCAAGAMWGPYLTDDPRSGRWAADTLSELAVLAADPVQTGVRLVSGIEAARGPAQPNALLCDLPGFEYCRSEDLPSGYHSGWRFTTASVDMPVYSTYLARRLLAAGGTMAVADVDDLAALRAAADLVVNCTGSGARQLVPDPSVTPLLGRVVVVTNPGLDAFFAEAGEAPELTWFVPHGPDRVVLGSTVESVPVNGPDALRRIVARCAAIEPLLAGSEILEWRAGFRPMRPSVRVEREQDWLIHNYGHGGSGVSLSWACAKEAFALVGATA
ncbi:FAD-dependent oxidoreductase [Solwaraspora sp. WMMD792]|uniref:FAD-dependent oxidoreductase n=1 Tax=Solwaraspora sp. WMMD792 TaxID=3016099 RepID=UPI002415CC4A|nr:FAD-dependent oxidoreductase [Solwaraspora sp. WMMD792]MDG4772710.1 FAD-dependent oxidoreductase [Solwaraspora sp. WMMD792]